jgi:hypothetical protein
MKKMSLNLTSLILVAALGAPPLSTPASVAEPVPLSQASATRSPAELESLVAPIALYPDPLVAVILSASAHPADVVYAARFMANNNDLAALDNQPWDANVKAAARFPSVIKKMNAELGWTVALGQAFTQQPLEVMDAIQAMRAKAQSVGTLQTTPEQAVSVNEAVVERSSDTQVIYVTNTIVQIMPANPEVIYVPQYNPDIIYDPPPSYIAASGPPLIYFGPGIAAGTIIVNHHPDWYYGGVYFGPGRIPLWVGFGPRPYYPAPPFHRPPRYNPGHRPPPYANHPRSPAAPPRPPGKPPQTPGNSPKPPANPPASPGNSPRPPGNSPRPPTKPPQSPGSPPQTPGNAPRPPKSPSQSPGNSPRPPANPPQSPSIPPQSPGNSPRPRNNSPQPSGNLPQSPGNRPFPPGDQPAPTPATPRPSVNPPPTVRNAPAGSKSPAPSPAPKN